MSIDTAELQTEIFRYLEKKLRVKVAELTADSPLLSNGLVDSGNLVRLATHLERLTGVSIPDRDIDADHFDTVEMIVAYVSARAAD
jgi:acyl carrier protein